MNVYDARKVAPPGYYQNKPTASALSKGEVSLGVKVIRANGNEENYSGNEVKQVEFPTELVDEYKALAHRMKEIEEVFLTLMIKQQGE